MAWGKERISDSSPSPLWWCWPFGFKASSPQAPLPGLSPGRVAPAPRHRWKFGRSVPTPGAGWKGSCSSQPPTSSSVTRTASTGSGSGGAASLGRAMRPPSPLPQGFRPEWGQPPTGTVSTSRADWVKVQLAGVPIPRSRNPHVAMGLQPLRQDCRHCAVLGGIGVAAGKWAVPTLRGQGEWSAAHCRTPQAEPPVVAEDVGKDDRERGDSATWARPVGPSRTSILVSLPEGLPRV
jgi:hypothetical protein